MCHWEDKFPVVCANEPLTVGTIFESSEELHKCDLHTADGTGFYILAFMEMFPKCYCMSNFETINFNFFSLSLWVANLTLKELHHNNI